MQSHTTFRKTLGWLTLTLVIAIGAHLYQYGAAGPLLDGSSDVQAIRITVAHDVQELTASGLRKPGEGVANGMMNNAETWFTTYTGCSRQSDLVASDLQTQFPAWQFKVVSSPLHHWIIASNGKTALRVDPWTGDLGQLIQN